jgi:hypothetical protein
MKMDHRLHDFVRLGERVYEAAGLSSAQFVKRLDDLRRSTGADIAAGDTFVIAMRKTLERFAQSAEAGTTLPGWKSWFPAGHAAVKLGSGEVLIGIRPKTLVAQLQLHAPGSNDWLPRNEREAGGALLRAGPIFANIGVILSKREPSSGNAYWEFCLSNDYTADGQ